MAVNQSYTHGVVENFIWAIEDANTPVFTIDLVQIVAFLTAQYGVERRIIYRDRLGVWDELVHEDGVFVDMTPMPRCFSFTPARMQH